MSVDIALTGVRVEKTEFYNNKNYTVVAFPAPDSFSFPSKFRLVSTQSIGNPGNLLDVQVTMRGLVKPKTYKDRDTGQTKTYDECDVYFDVVSHRAHLPVQAPSSAKAS